MPSIQNNPTKYRHLLKSFFCFFTIVLLVSPSYLFSQLIDFQHFNSNHGLSENTVTSITQDELGFVWIGTMDGLNRFDGYNFKIYKLNAARENSLRNNFITSLLNDSEGILWVGTQGGGLHYYNSLNDDFIYYDLGESTETIRTLFEASDSSLWIGTNRGLIHLDKKEGRYKLYAKSETDEQSIQDNIVSGIAEDSKGNIWLATDYGGLNRLDVSNGTFKYFGLISSQESSTVSSVLKTLYYDGSYLWIGTLENGLLRFNPEDETFTQIPFSNDRHFPDGLGHKTVETIIPESAHELWIGTLGGGLSLYNTASSEFIHYISSKIDEHSLSKNAVVSLLKDSRGNLWVGTIGGGINFYDKYKKQFLLFRNNPFNQNSLSISSVLSIAEDNSGNIVFGTDEGGVSYYNKSNKQFTNYQKDENNPNSPGHHVVSALLNRNGQIWLGYMNHCFDRFDQLQQQFIHYRDLRGSSNAEHDFGIFNMSSDRSGNLWIGTNGEGLCRYNPENVTYAFYKKSETDENSISNNYVTSILEYNEEELWVGTWEGLNLIHPASGKITRFMHNDQLSGSISNNEVTNLFVDSRSNLWIGTFGGLNLYDRASDSFSRIGEEDGLPNNVICGIQEDSHGNLWISTYKGICRYNHASGDFRAYDVTDGLQGNQFNLRSSIKARDGYMYFGGINGVTWFHPDSISDNSYVPKVLFTDFKLLNKPVIIGAKGSPLSKTIWQTEEIQLKYYQSAFTFEFVALNFTSSGKANYKYQLIGYDDDWVDIGAARSAAYTNVQPGNYTFRVIASNSDNIWIESALSIEVHISPPYWQTIWFKIFIASIVISLLFILFTVRVRRIKKQNEILEDRVIRRTATVMSQKEEIEKQASSLKKANTEIIQKNVMLEDQKEEIEEQAEQIKEMNYLLQLKNEDLQKNIQVISKDRVMQKRVSYEEFCEIYPDDNSCLEFIRMQKEALKFSCKKCKSDEFYNMKDPFFRRCKKCGYRESLTANTIFQNIKFPIVKAFYILYLVSTGRELTVEELSRLVELRRETAWSFRNKVMEIMSLRKRFKNPREGWRELIMLPKNYKE